MPPLSYVTGYSVAIASISGAPRREGWGVTTPPFETEPLFLK